MKNPLLNKELIEALDKDNQREVYAKIISLNLNEQPIEEIQGKVSQGTLSIDGNSAVRRTCSLTIIADRVNIHEYYWSFTTKFKLFIGLKIPKHLKEKTVILEGASLDNKTGKINLSERVNYPYEDYPDIVWFPQGIFLITDFKYLLNTNGTDNIYITGKDKMSLLNGELGGTFPHATDVGTIDIESEYDETGILYDKKTEPLKIQQIITDMVHKYGGEPFHNIVVNDLDDKGLIMLDYNGDNDIYLFKNVSTGLFENVIFDGDVVRYDKNNNPVKVSEIKVYDTMMSDYVSYDAQRVKSTNSLLDTTFYTVVKCSYGTVLGYRTTDWTYPSEGGELVMDVGTTVTNALDKICEAFDNIYEYFYDVEGKFIFQKRLTYVNTSWNNLINTWELNEKEELEKSTYAESNKLVSQVQYSFIGNQMTTMLNNNPNINNIKNDYAIWGKKKANSVGKENAIHMRVAIDEKPEKYTNFKGVTYTDQEWDWRELIFQMAQDYYDHNHEDDYEIKLHELNPTYPFGKTGYETYYEDILGFWRYLYDPESTDNDIYVVKQDANETENSFKQKQYWNREIFDNPAGLLFWFDFLNSKTTNLGKYSVKAIGDRTKTVNNDKIKAISYGEIPNIIYTTHDEYKELEMAHLVNDGYTYIVLSDVMGEYFDATRKEKSAQDELDQLVYQYAYCNESITITSIPVYHLEPNMRIKVYDNKTKIDGDYIVNKIVISLNYNGTMQIMASKAPIRLF